MKSACPILGGKTKEKNVLTQAIKKRHICFNPFPLLAIWISFKEGLMFVLAGSSSSKSAISEAEGNTNHFHLL